MKAASLLLFLIPVSCLAQTTKTNATKQSTTNCPTFVNKPQLSKAAYFESLRHTKAAKEPGSISKSNKAVKNPAEKPKTETAHASMFSSSDELLAEKKPAPSKPEEKKSTINEIPEEKEELATTETKISKAEKKAAKKKSIPSNSGRVRTSKRNTEKCPSF